MNKPATDSRSKLSRLALQRLEDLERAGVTHLPKKKRQSQVEVETPMGKHPHPGPLPKGEGGESDRCSIHLRRKAENCAATGTGCGPSGDSA